LSSAVPIATRIAISAIITTDHSAAHRTSLVASARTASPAGDHVMTSGNAAAQPKTSPLPGMAMDAARRRGAKPTRETAA
jgi:hypothetical protein